MSQGGYREGVPGPAHCAPGLCEPDLFPSSMVYCHTHTHPNIPYCMSRCGASPYMTKMEEPPLFGDPPRAMDRIPVVMKAGSTQGRREGRQGEKMES